MERFEQLFSLYDEQEAALEQLALTAVAAGRDAVERGAEEGDMIDEQPPDDSPCEQEVAIDGSAKCKCCEQLNDADWEMGVGDPCKSCALVTYLSALSLNEIEDALQEFDVSEDDSILWQKVGRLSFPWLFWQLDRVKESWYDIYLDMLHANESKTRYNFLHALFNYRIGTVKQVRWCEKEEGKHREDDDVVAIAFSATITAYPRSARRLMQHVSELYPTLLLAMARSVPSIADFLLRLGSPLAVYLTFSQEQKEEVVAFRTFYPEKVYSRFRAEGVTDVRLNAKLVVAVADNNVSEVTRLLEAGANPGWRGGDCLIVAVQRGRDKLVSLLLSCDKVKVPKDIISRAVYHAPVSILSLLLEDGRADPNGCGFVIPSDAKTWEEDAYGERYKSYNEWVPPPLEAALKYGCPTHLAVLLKDKRTIPSQNILQRAVEYRKTWAVSLLLADGRVQNSDKALKRAQEMQHAPLVKLLETYRSVACS